MSDRGLCAQDAVALLNQECMHHMIHQEFTVHTIVDRTSTMNRLLIVASLKLTTPDRCPSNFSTFADKNVTRLQSKSISFLFRKIHLKKVTDIDSSPLNVRVA